MMIGERFKVIAMGGSRLKHRRALLLRLLARDDHGRGRHAGDASPSADCSPAFADEIIHYANTCLKQESGDVAGYVVIVSDGEPLPSISLGWSEGALRAVLLIISKSKYGRASHDADLGASRWESSISVEAHSLRNRFKIQAGVL
jgi:hypothetical protein